MCCHFIIEMMSKVPARWMTTSAKKIKSFEEIPGPKSLPVIGNLWRYAIGQYSFEKLHKTYATMYKQYGPIVREHVFGNRLIVHLYDPDDMHLVHSVSGSKPVRISHTVLAKYRRGRPHLYNGPGLFPSNGDEWYKIRQLFQTNFLWITNVKKVAGGMENVTDDLVAKLPSCLDQDREVEMLPLLIRFALESIGVVTLNKRLGCLSENPDAEIMSLIQAAGDTHSAVYKAENSPPILKYFCYKKLEAAQDLLSGVVVKHMDEAIKQHLEGVRTGSSMLELMLDNKGADKKDVFAMVIDLFMAGIDTTAYALSFALYNLAKNKEVQDKLREEVVKILPTKESKMPLDLLPFPYLRAVVSETLRVNPLAIGTGRILPKDVVLSGYKVPEKTMVILQHQVASMLPKYFPEPEKFKPSRWIEKDSQVTFMAYSPFGYGARVCVGKTIAIRELQIALAKLIRNFEFEYHHEDIDTINRLINVPDSSVKMRLKSVDY